MGKLGVPMVGQWKSRGITHFLHAGPTYPDLGEDGTALEGAVYQSWLRAHSSGRTRDVWGQAGSLAGRCGAAVSRS